MQKNKDIARRFWPLFLFRCPCFGFYVFKTNLATPRRTKPAVLIESWSVMGEHRHHSWLILLYDLLSIEKQVDFMWNYPCRFRVEWPRIGSVEVFCFQSLGVVLYILVCGGFPFPGNSLEKLKTAVLTGQVNIPFIVSVGKLLGCSTMRKQLHACFT